MTVSETWTLWALLLALAAFGLWAERARWGARRSAVVITLISAMLVSNLGLLPHDSSLYQVIRDFLIPLAIPMLILQADVIRGWRDLAMVAGALLLSIVCTLVATSLVFFFLPETIDAQDWVNTTIAGLVGGQSQRPEHALLLAIYLIVLFTLPSIRNLRQWFFEPIPDGRWGNTVEILITEHRKGNRLYLPSIGLTLAISAAICTGAYFMAATFDFAGKELVIIAAVSLLLSLVLPKRIAELSGAEDLGILIMLLLFAVIGASADFSILANQPMLVGRVALVMLIQTATLLAIGKYLFFSLPQLVIAANAGVGGPASATAMAATRRWHTLLFPAVFYATLGQLLADPAAALLLGWLR